MSTTAIVYTDAMRLEWRKAFGVYTGHPASLTDRDIEILSEQPDYAPDKRSEWRQDCLTRRDQARRQLAEGRMSRHTKSAPAVVQPATPAPRIQRLTAEARQLRQMAADYVKAAQTSEERARREDDMQFVGLLLESPDRAATRYECAALAFLTFQWIASITAKSAAREQKIATLDAKCAALEAKSAGVWWAGAWKAGEAYAEGGLVTRQGGLWLATRSAALGTPGDVNSGWQLVVKSGQAPRA